MIDNRGEIQQYLRALIACEGELLVIVEKYGKEAAATIAEIKAYPKAKIYALQGDETDVESNAQKLYDKIVNFLRNYSCTYAPNPVLRSLFSTLCPKKLSTTKSI